MGIVTTDRTGADGYDITGNETLTFAGTSASAPIVSGAAALLLSRHPDLTASTVRTLLRQTADKVGALTYTGGAAGANGRNDYYGYGRLNVGRLLWLARVTVVAGFGGASATANASSTFFGEPEQLPTLLAAAGDYFTFQQWTATPATNALVYAPAAAETVATISDDVTLTAMFDPMLAALGTPLYWLAEHGLDTPDFDTAETSDDDDDGHAAWQEWQAGTDPDDGASVFRVSSFEHLGDGRCAVTWASVTNRIYDVLASATPDGASPTVVAENLAATVPLNVYTTAPLPTAASFVRIRAKTP